MSFLAFLMAPGAFPKSEKMAYGFPNVKTSLNLDIKAKKSHRLLIVAPKMNVRLISISFPMCNCQALVQILVPTGSKSNKSLPKKKKKDLDLGLTQ